MACPCLALSAEAAVGVLTLLACWLGYCYYYCYSFYFWFACRMLIIVAMELISEPFSIIMRATAPAAAVLFKLAYCC